MHLQSHMGIELAAVFMNMLEEFGIMDKVEQRLHNIP